MLPARIEFDSAVYAAFVSKHQQDVIVARLFPPKVSALPQNGAH